MRKITIATAVLAVALGSGAAWAQSTTISGSPHDLSTRLGTGQVCLSCHAPHHGINTNSNQPGPIWNHALPVGGASGFTQGGSSITLMGNTLLCMGCHDGVTAVGAFTILDPTANAGYTAAGNGALTIQNLPGATTGTDMSGNPVVLGNLTTDLSATHPVEATYRVLSGSDSSSFHAAVSGKIGGTLRLENDATGTPTLVGCSTCHNPHDDSRGNFLRVANAGSALCLTCHIH